MPSGTIDTIKNAIDSIKAGCCRCLTCGICCRPKVPEPKELEEAMLQVESNYVPKSDLANLSSNLRWSLLPGFSIPGRRWCLPHFMAPINVNVVHRTAANQGYAGLVYRERMGSSHGCCSLWGFLPMFVGILVMLISGFILFVIPGTSCLILRLRDKVNPPARKAVKDNVFNRFSSTGRVETEGVGQSVSGKTTVNTFLTWDYDAGLGMTMLSACTIAGVLANGEAKRGYHTAITAIGGDALVEAMKRTGHFTISVTKS